MTSQRIHNIVPDRNRGDAIDQANAQEALLEEIRNQAILEGNKREIAHQAAIAQVLGGMCQECGGEISERRRKALPYAARCRDCEEALENPNHRN